MRAARELHITGSVQGVGFRWTAKRIADSIGLSGWVRNNADGSVSLALEGGDAEIDEFVERLNDAMGLSMTTVASRDVRSGANRNGFDIVR